MIGIKNGMMMQRGEDNTCAIWLENDEAVSRVRFDGAASGEARVTACGGRYHITGIPVGGPYTVQVDDVVYQDVYVGDVWLLGGQSNMQGVGQLTAEDIVFAGDEAVRALYMDDIWRPAKHVLHQVWTAVDKVHTEVLGAGKPEVLFNGVGPGLAFGQRMKELEGVPQGLICCAHGGSTMAQWSPAIKGEGGDKSLYGAMLRRFRTNGAHVRGLFWHQGCSETGDWGHFTADMLEFYRNVREDFGAELPIVQVQISRVLDNASGTCGWNPVGWSDIREQQRTLSASVKRLHTVTTIHLALDDLIHLSSASQKALGTEAAESMTHLLYGTDERGCLPPPAFRELRIYPQRYTGTAIVELSYDHLHGSLTALGRPSGFVISREAGVMETPHIFDVRLHGNTVQLCTACTPQELEGCCVYYGFGLDPYCNITDQAGRSIPAMGPIRL